MESLIQTVVGAIHGVLATCPVCCRRESLEHTFLCSSAPGCCPSLAPQNFLLKFLCTLPTAFPLCTSCLWPHKDMRLSRQPLSGIGQDGHTSGQEKKAWEGVLCDCAVYTQSRLVSCIWTHLLWVASTNSFYCFTEQWALSGGWLGIPIQFFLFKSVTCTSDPGFLFCLVFSPICAIPWN